MLNESAILIVEDNFFISLDLSLAVLEAGGTVVGPAASLEAAMTLVKSQNIDGAILDARLPDGHIDFVLDHLCECGIPVILYTGLDRPLKSRFAYPIFQSMRKPLDTGLVVSQLVQMIDQVAVAPVRTVAGAAAANPR